MLKRINHVLSFFIQIFILLFSVSPSYANLVSYSSFTTTGSWDQVVEVDYSDEVYVDRQLYSPTLYLMDKFTKIHKPTSTIAKAYDKKQIKDILLLGADLTSQTVNPGTAATITLAANEKDNLVVNQVIEMGFTPTSAGYTNYVKVSDKNVNDTTTIQVVPEDPANLIGIANGTPVPSGTVLNVLGTTFPRGSGSVAGIAHYPTTIENYYQDFRYPFELDDIAATEKMYIKGTPEAIHEADSRAAFMMHREKTFLFEGPGYLKRVQSNTDRVEIGNMKGLIYSVKNGGGPAVESYDTFSMEHFDNWQWNLADTDINDLAGIRFVLANKAFRKFFTDQKKNNPGWIFDKVPLDTYGIPGISVIETDAITMQIYVHPAIQRRFPDKDKPFALAVTLPYVEYRPWKRVHMRANIQNNDETKIKHEFRAIDTFILHQANTAFHGCMFSTAQA